MPCKPISIALQVDPPSGDTEISFKLDKTCNDDGTASWKLHFELDQKAASGNTPIVKLDIDINDEDAGKAQSTAKHGLDGNQRAQADNAAQTALGVKTGDATADDAKQAASAVIPARSSSSPQ